MESGDGTEGVDDQLLMLEEEELSHFEDLFQQGKRFEIKNFLWLSWLPLKLAAVGTESEAFDFVLQERTPANVPKSLRELRGSILSQRNTNRYSERGLRPRRRKTRKRKQL